MHLLIIYQLLFQSIEPALNKCVTYISARGLDRLAVLLEWVIIQFTASKCAYISDRGFERVAVLLELVNIHLTASKCDLHICQRAGLGSCLTEVFHQTGKNK